MRPQFPYFLPLCTIAVTVLACTANSNGPGVSTTPEGQGGATSNPAGGFPATSNSSSSNSTGGTQITSSGGSGGVGGSSAMTGATVAGGSLATGGSVTISSGGSGTSSTPKGGAVNSGGTLATTHSSMAGGTSATGGTVTSAGVTAKGGTSATGGTATTGGTVATGGASACSWSSAPASDNGRLTCYWFSQGTGNNFKDCPGGKYKTACGYCGTETGKKDTSNNYPCAVGEVTDTVEHISTSHFAAFPAGMYSNNNYCGMCVEVTYGSRTITATIVDNCASCQQTGHLDLSLSASEALGMGGMIGEYTMGVSWKAVACPVTENIYVLYNGGVQTNQAYFQNVPFPVISVKYDGKSANQYGSPFWSFDSEMAGKAVTLTDIAGHSIQGTMPTTLPGGTLGVQFPLTCQ